MRNLKDILTENFYKTVSHNDPLFKMNIKLQDILNTFKKMGNSRNASSIHHMIDDFEDGYGIMFLDAEGTPYYFHAKNSSSSKVEWRCWKRDTRRGWVDCGWSFAGSVIDDMLDLYKHGFTFEVRKTEDVIPW